MKIRLAVLCALLIPATALAQAPQDVDPNAPPPTAPPPAPAPPTTTTTVTTPPPVVIVNPPQPERPSVVTTTPEYETVYDRYNAPMFVTGALVFLGSYGASVIVAASSGQQELDRGNDRLYVPVIGPWLALNDRGSCPITSSSCDNETTKKVLLVADGVFQAAGVITMVGGILSPSSHRTVVRTTSNKVRVTPTVVGTQHLTPGLSLSGAF